MNMPYTQISNGILRDFSLSLPAKGLYLTLRSFAGLPNFCLKKNRLKNTFSGSNYEFEQAWKELKICGYLKHFYYTAVNGAFVHVYDLHPERQAVQELMSYAPNQTRSHGDLRFIPSGAANDYTTVPDAIARDCKLSLKTKGLYAVLSYLFKIPNFHFSWNSLISLCKEKAKALKTIWTALKRSGLLKQHRHPTGEHNQFDYTYDLLLESNLNEPYFTNHRADGTITSSLSVDFNAPVPEKKKKRKNTRIFLPAKSQDTQTESLHTPHTFQKIARVRQYPLSKQVDKAIAALCKNKRMRLNGAVVSLESRQKAVASLTPELLEQFEFQFKLPSNVHAPIPYIATALYQFVQEPHTWIRTSTSNTDKLGTVTSDTEASPLTIDEMDCMIQAIYYRIKQAAQEHIVPLSQDVHFADSYAALLETRMSIPETEFEQRLRQLLAIWKNQ